MRVSQSQESVLLGTGSSTAAGSHGWGDSDRINCGTSLFSELPESWADMQEPLLEGMCFTLKYLGMTLVEKPKGEDMAAAAIRRIVATVRPSPGLRAQPLHSGKCLYPSPELQCPSQEEGGMQEVPGVCLCAVEKLFFLHNSYFLPHLTLSGSIAVPATAQRGG